VLIVAVFAATVKLDVAVLIPAALTATVTPLVVTAAFNEAVQKGVDRNGLVHNDVCMIIKWGRQHES
jgi:hypothetical protein